MTNSKELEKLLGDYGKENLAYAIEGVKSGQELEELDAYFEPIAQKYIAALTALIDRTVAEREKKAYLRGYNSGWVKANRLTAKPQSIEYLAKQLEASAATLRAAVQTQGESSNV